MKAKNLLLLVVSASMLASCGGTSSTPAGTSEATSEGEESSFEESIEFSKKELFKFVETENGKKLVVKDYFESKVGAFGVLIGLDDVDQLTPMYSSNYSSVVENDGVYTCTASVTSDNGSTFSTIDKIYEEGGHVKIERDFTVEASNVLDLGFSVYFQMEDVEPKTVEDYKWFCPSAYYGNDEWGLTGTGCKTAYSTDHAVVMNDNSGTPLLMNYIDNVGFSLLDTSDGFRETIAADYGVHDCHIQVDERFNLGGVGMYQLEDGHTQVFQNYPSYTYNSMGIFNFMTQYRMLPVTVGLTRHLSFDINCEEYEDFYDGCKENYRYSYEHYYVIDKRYSGIDVYNKSLSYLDNSYGIKSNIPQYMLNSDHPWIDSGFLYRNSDIAYLMLAAGRRINNTKWVDNALTVMENQIDNDRLDEGLIASDDYCYRHRSAADALYNLTLNYAAEKKAGIDHRDWLTYLRTKATGRMSSTYWADAMFLSEFARVSNSKSYLNKARELMDEIKPRHLNYEYIDVISNPNAEKTVEKEGAIIALIANINIYEQLKDSDPTAAAEYLEMAEHNALAVESFQIVQPVCLDSYDNPGYGKDEITDQEFNQGCMGNKRFLAYGINYVCSQTCSGDNANVLCAPEFYKLAQYTGDSHYQSFYEYLTYNSTLYVNMGDKCGYMDDILYSSGYGFQNEYFGVSTSEDSASYRRGCIHDSNLAWNMYAVVQNYERMYELTGSYLGCDDNNRDFDIKKNKYVNETEEGYVVDLYELCSVSSIEGFEGNVEFSVDGTTYKSGTTSKCAAYVRFPLTTDIKNVKVIGLPLTYSALNYDCASVNNGVFEKAQDWNYKTTCSIDKNVDIIIDLGETHTLAEVALKPESLVSASFDVAVSADGNSYTNYGSVSSKVYFLHVIEKNVENVRYVKLTNRSSSGPLVIKEFKVLGV